MNEFTNRKLVKTSVTYVWVDGSGINTRSKTRTVEKLVTNLSDVPNWNYDGSSTGQAERQSSEVELVPVALFRDPFANTENPACFLALCKTQSARDRVATEKGDKRHIAETIFTNPAVSKLQCWFGIEQEYVLIDSHTERPLGWPSDPSLEPKEQGPYYCSVLANKGHTIASKHYSACLFAGIRISGYNAEVMPGQWEYQIGPCEGLDAGDHLWAARYILQRVCSLHDCVPSLDPKPVVGDWNGSGLHTNFSTVEMRVPPSLPSPLRSCSATIPVVSSAAKSKVDKVNTNDTTETTESRWKNDNLATWQALVGAVNKLKVRHKQHMLVYGDGNERRMTGDHETSGADRCTFGIGDRGASIRIGEQVYRDGYGYLEDRRPASSANPYLVTAAIAETTILF